MESVEATREIKVATEIDVAALDHPPEPVQPLKPVKPPVQDREA